MNRRPNTSKCILGVVMVVLLVIGGLATTTARLTTNAKANLATLAKPGVGATSPLQGPPASCTDVFASIDGTASGSPQDWNDIISSADANAVPPQGAISGPSGNALVRTYVNDLGGTDQIFTQGGSKDFNDLSDWRHTTGSVPDKDEITAGGAAKYHDSNNGHDILVFFANRFANNGDSNIGFWFFQNPVVVGPNGLFVDPNTGLPAHHADGDIFILSSFTQGGGQSTIRVLKWVGANGLVECTAPGFLDPKSDTTTFPNGSLCDFNSPTPPGSGIVNNGQISVNWPYSQKGGVSCTAGPCSVPQAGLFFEGCVDLTALNLQNTCFSSFLLETRSSAEVSAVLKDFALGSFNTCAAINVTKTASPTEACAGTPVTYTYTVTNTATVSESVTLVDDNGTPSDPSDDFCIVPPSQGGACGTFPASSGSCSFTLTSGESRTCTVSGVILPVGTTKNTVTATANFGSSTASKTASATVIINPNPSCTVSPSSAFVCFGGSQQFCANVTSGTSPFTYSWNTGETTQCITTGIAGTYTVTVTDSKGCTTMCSATLSVNPALSCSVNNAERCSDGPAQTLTATPVGGTPGYTYLWNTGETTASISKTAAGTYTCTITDSLGCKTQCSGTLTVNPKPTVTINSVTCSTNSSITLTATPSGGTGTTTFLWSTGETTASITVSATGTYSVTVTDTKGCTGTASRTVGLCAP